MTLGRCPLSIFCSRGTPESINNNYFTEVCSSSDKGSYLRLKDSAAAEPRPG